jgi:uncharacterized cupin superfamily protein
MPIDDSAPAEATQQAGFVKHTNFVGVGGGTTFRINEFAPGSMRFTPRTETMDYVLHLSGEIDCELENGEVVHLKPGDVMIQRGTIHTWVNRGSVLAVIAFILIDAKPVEVNGKKCVPFSRCLTDREKSKSMRECDRQLRTALMSACGSVSRAADLNKAVGGWCPRHNRPGHIAPTDDLKRNSGWQSKKEEQ